MPEIERVIPVLVYEDIAAGHDFLVEAFGFTSGGVHRNAEGKPIHAEVRAGDLVIWLHRAAAELNLASPTLDVGCQLRFSSSGQGCGCTL